MAATNPVRPAQNPAGEETSWTWLALLVALVGAWGTLHLSLAMGLAACPLCYYQRAFLFGVVALLGVGVVARLEKRAPLCYLALSLAAAGLGVAGYHVYLVATEKLECPLGIGDWGPAPYQAFALFLLLTILLLIGAIRFGSPGTDLPRILIGLLLGGLLAYGCIASVAMPPAKALTKPYEEPLITCRPPYKAS
jgi:disulfide bond formation protein DsbB